MELIQGKKYLLKRTGNFCHCMGITGFVDFSDSMGADDRIEALFVGTVKISLGNRNLFFCSDPIRSYISFADTNLDYVVEQLD